MNDHISLIGDKNNLHDKMEKGKPRELKVCAQCNKEIEGKFMLRALGQFWHEECLKCSYCSTQLTDLSFKFYLKGDLILCKRDYIRWELRFLCCYDLDYYQGVLRLLPSRSTAWAITAKTKGGPNGFPSFSRLRALVICPSQATMLRQERIQRSFIHSCLIGRPAFQHPQGPASLIHKQRKENIIFSW